MVRLVFAAAFVAAGLGSAQAADPAFDCTRAEHEIEVLICGDDALAAKDRALAAVYDEALAATAEMGDAEAAAQYLRTTQRGWIGGRDECWKAEDKTACTADLYDRRIAELQVRYGLVAAGKPHFYRCDDNSEIVASFVDTEPPTVRLERGDTTEIGFIAPSGSGSRYEASFGISFWIKGDTAMVEWPQGTAFDCATSD
ncbi:MAG: MliC family protein [Acuticoccus sp.]